MSTTITNMAQFIRVPGGPRATLSDALQNWDGLNVAKSQPEGGEPTYELVIRNDSGQYKLAISEQIYEVALYTFATRRFTEWMKANRHKIHETMMGAQQ